MQTILYLVDKYRYMPIIAGVVFFVCSLLFAGHVSADSESQTKSGRLVTIHDRGTEKVVLTHASTVKDALTAANIHTNSDDIVEPKHDKELVAQNYTVNIYRARPVIVVDGMLKQKVMTAAQTPKDIAKSANVTLRSEDKTAITVSGNIASDGASEVLTITRAKAVTLHLYGTPTQVYTHAKTVGEMLKQKGINLLEKDTITPGLQTPLTEEMIVMVWRDGVQTATVEEPVAFTVRKIQDADQPIGFQKVQIAGIEGRKKVTYEITAAAGKEVSRKAIQSMTIVEPIEQVEIIGIKPGPNSLTKAKGAQHFTDSKGVTHRETYYDLPMNIVMGACGGGSYTIRADGAKIDKDGYILVAAHLGNYPRCSIVETSMGLGKVYDTGGFTAKHPLGFDLATDWTKADGR